MTTVPGADSPPRSSTTETGIPLTVAPGSTGGTPFASRIEWDGDDRYIHGANLPWINFGCDFGCGTDGGVSSEAVRRVADEAFGRARDMGMSVVRWWVFPGSPTAITTNADGLPAGLDPDVFSDLDAAVELADEYDLDLILTLFASPSDLPDQWLTSAVGRGRLRDVLVPLFGRYPGPSRIMTWQVFNEPEWDFWLSERQDDVDATRELVNLVADAVHDESEALVSIGSARLDGLGYWIGTNLDYYTVHWYDSMTAPDQCAICTTYAELAAAMETDAPIMVGEFYAGSEVAPDDRFQEFYDRGYAGALAWSLLPERTHDRLQIDVTVATRFGEFVDQQEAG